METSLVLLGEYAIWAGEYKLLLYGIVTGLASAKKIYSLGPKEYTLLLHEIVFCPVLIGK